MPLPGVSMQPRPPNEHLVSPLRPQVVALLVRPLGLADSRYKAVAGMSRAFLAEASCLAGCRLAALHACVLCTVHLCCHVLDSCGLSP